MKLELALLVPDRPGQPFVRLTWEELTAALRAVGLSPEQAAAAGQRLAAAIDLKARNA